MDFLPTKGIEYLLVIAYLVVLIPVWWFLRRSAGEPVAISATALGRARAEAGSGWFDVPLDPTVYSQLESMISRKSFWGSRTRSSCRRPDGCSSRVGPVGSSACEDTSSMCFPPFLERSLP